LRFKALDNGRVRGYFPELTPKDQKNSIRRYICKVSDVQLPDGSLDVERTIQYWTDMYVRIERSQYFRDHKFDHLCDQYQAHVEKTLGRNTWLNYKKGIYRFLDEVRGLDIEEFEEVHSDDFKARMRNLSNRTQRSYCTSVNMFLNWIREQKIPHSAKIKLPKERRTNARPYLPEEIEAVTQEIRRAFLRGEKKYQINYWNHLRAWMMMHLTGMRRSEVYGLKYSDIKPEWINIRDNPDLGVFIKGATEEDVAIGKALSEFLLEDKAFCKDRKIISRKVYLCGYDGQIFCKSVDTLTQALGRHVKNAGIDPDAKICHGLRASFITSVYENFGIGEAQDLARHKSPNTTRQYIPEGSKTKKRQAIIDSLFTTLPQQA